MKFNSLLLAGAALFVATGAQAQTVFDSQALTNQEPGRYQTPETRSSDANYAAVLHFTNAVTINQLGIYTAINNAQDIKFLIFDSALNGGTGNLLFSQVKTFNANPIQQFIYSDPLAFTFAAGHTYDVGILGSTGSLTGFWSAGGGLSSNGITEISQNANFNNFSSPSTGGYAGVTPFIQLRTTAVGAVPEPATWAMMLVGFGMAGFGLRRRSKQTVRVTYA